MARGLLRYENGAVQAIFVGDVQGCADELAGLVARARSEFGDRFELRLVGDLVNRGPDSLGVLRTVRSLAESGRAQFVLGNHEVMLLRTAAGQRRMAPLDSFADVLRADASEGWIDWLRTRPLALSGTLGEQAYVMVHAAVHPKWSLPDLLRRVRKVEERLSTPSRADAEAFLATRPEDDEDRDLLRRLTGCRSAGPGNDWSQELPAGKRLPWHERWSRAAHPYGVVYGHWALQGLHVAPWLRGLDTGCVHHGRGHDGALTAWLPDAAAPCPFEVPDDAFWRVPATRAYYAQRIAEVGGPRGKPD